MVNIRSRASSPPPRDYASVVRGRRKEPTGTYEPIATVAMTSSARRIYSIYTTTYNIDVHIYVVTHYVRPIVDL